MKRNEQITWIAVGLALFFIVVLIISALSDI